MHLPYLLFAHHFTGKCVMNIWKSARVLLKLVCSQRDKYQEMVKSSVCLQLIPFLRSKLNDMLYTRQVGEFKRTSRINASWCNL